MKIIFIIAFRNFKDEEYFVPKGILENAGAKVKTASNKTGMAIGADGGEANVDFLVSDISPENFDAVVFVGGSGTLKNLDNENSYKLAKETVAQGKILAAICLAPVILARAGVLRRKTATVWTSPMDKSTVKVLEDNGAIYSENSVVTDGKIITASGPSAAKGFGEKIKEAMMLIRFYPKTA